MIYWSIHARLFKWRFHGNQFSGDKFFLQLFAKIWLLLVPPFWQYWKFLIDQMVLDRSEVGKDPKSEIYLYVSIESRRIKRRSNIGNRSNIFDQIDFAHQGHWVFFGKKRKHEKSAALKMDEWTNWKINDHFLHRILQKLKFVESFNSLLNLFSFAIANDMI